jgi:DNA-binding LacI/PurR family transcriptional regulator
MKAPGTSYEAGYLATQQLLARGRKFTALATFDDSTAFGAIRALVEVGRPVPADCSIVGFDDVTTASYMNPPLTTVRQPMEALGSRAVEIFLKLAESFFAEQAIPTVHDKIDAKLIVRASTAPIVGDAL